jgi:hypothetical protein
MVAAITGSERIVTSLYKSKLSKWDTDLDHLKFTIIEQSCRTIPQLICIWYRYRNDMGSCEHGIGGGGYKLSDYQLLEAGCIRWIDSIDYVFSAIN